MSTWGDIGLPAIDPKGYRYDVDSGLLRTSFITSNPRQRRQNESNKRTFELQATLDVVQLPVALGYLNNFGYTWFALPLLTGSLDEPIVSLCVRLTKEYQVSVLGKGVYRLGFTVEQLVERSIIATTDLYPIEVIESIGVAAPAGWAGQNYSFAQNAYISVGAPAGWTGTNVQTVFHHYYTTDIEMLAVGAPDGWTGTDQQTIFHTFISQHEDAAIGAPDAWTGTLTQTVFPLTYNDYESFGVSAPDGWTGALTGP